MSVLDRKYAWWHSTTTMKLNVYLETKKISATRLAHLAEVHPSIVLRYAKNQRGLSPSTAQKLSAATFGAVSVEELLFPARPRKKPMMTVDQAPLHGRVAFRDSQNQ